jgi:hypothetical protein
MTIDQDVASIHGAQGVDTDDFVRRTQVEERSCLQHQNSIAVLARKIQIMGDEHHGQATLLLKPTHNRADFNLMLEIEKRSRFVK